MEIHHEPLSQIETFLRKFGNEDLNSPEKRRQYAGYLKMVQPYVKLGPETRLLEIGTGTGWLPVMCAMDGLHCKGLDISPELLAHGRKLAARYGVEVDIHLGNIEESDVGDNEFDAIFASSVFEHVEHWERGLERVYKALRPGGVLFFSSTNKFSFTSGEYSFPLYGWLPNPLRFKLRIAMQGPDVMKLGIDFNQFRYPMLRREMRRVGFEKILDRFERIDLAELQSPMRKAVAGTLKTLPPLRHLALAFSSATVFVCIK